MNPFAVGALLNSALYLSATFVSGLVTNHGLAWKLAVATMGLTYFNHVIQYVSGGRDDVPTSVLIWATRVCGAAAGIALLW